MRQLEPGAGEHFAEISRVRTEALGDLAVLGIKSECHVGVGHDRLAADRRIFYVDRHVVFLDVHRLPLVGPGRRLLQPPVVPEEQVEVATLADIPFRRMGRPRALDAAGQGVAPDAAGCVVVPAQALLLDAGALGGRAEIGRAAVAVRLADGMATSGQRHGFLIVHRHAGEGDAHVLGCLDRIGLAVDAFRVDVDQPHHHRGQRVLQFAFAGPAAALAAGRGKPFLLGAPVDVLFRMPDILAAEGEAEGLQAHRLVGHVAGEDHQVGPAHLVAVLLLDRPEESPRLVEIGVVRPRVERCEALVAGAAAAAAVGDAVGAR